jgi:quinoprotein glucose dehydrogenase
MRQAALLLMGAAMICPTLAQAAGPAPTDWPVFGYDSGSTRFSPLTQITPANVGRLTLAWSYDIRPAGVARSDPALLKQQAQARWTAQQGIRPLNPGLPPPISKQPAPPAGFGDAPAPPAGPTGPSSGSEVTPIVVGDRMYFGTPFGRIVALDATTGRELWVLPLPDNEQPALRGLAYWPGDAQNAARLVVMTRSNKVLTVDPQAGRINSSYGILNLRTPDVMGHFPQGNLSGNGVPVLYGTLMILASRGQENPQKGPRGDVRAFDIVTGRMVWRFNSIPEPGEPNFGTWQGDSWKDRAGVNDWNSPTVDTERGIVYFGFGTPASDRIGADRVGMNLYGTSIVALDARTGRYLWHFQLTHHDLWDRDVTGIPTLIEVRRGGKTIPAVAAINKQSILFILDRVTGKPLFKVTEKPVPASDVPGEQAWPTQPIPARPEPLARQSIDLATDISDVTPEHEAWCKQWVKSLNMQSSVQYQPLGYNVPTVIFPGTGGGMNWWGGAFDKANGTYIVNVNNEGTVDMIRQGPNGQLQAGFSANSWFADVRNGGMDCQKGPWGEIMAVNVSIGNIVWRRSLGVTDSLPPGKRDTGRHMAGGPIVTAGGIIFVAATDDKRFRALDARTGKLLWEFTLEAAGNATPLTYMGRDGKQYVSLMATGGSYLSDPSTSDDLVTFALP